MEIFRKGKEKQKRRNKRAVLILVVMEIFRKVKKNIRQHYLNSLNPCCNGNLSKEHK